MTLDPSSGQAIAAAYELGDVLDFVGPVDRGELGEVWRLTSTTGSWAVKITFAGLAEDAAESSAQLQTLARSRGVPAPDHLGRWPLHRRLGQRRPRRSEP